MTERRRDLTGRPLEAINLPTRGADQMIKPHYDDKLDLTTYICTGPVTAVEIEKEIRKLYKGTPSLNAMWDYTEADLALLSPDDIRGIAKVVKDTSHSRAGGRTALVFSNAMLTEMGSLLASISEIEVPDAKIKVFNDLTAALAWIGD
jgi:hypothetical protein